MAEEFLARGWNVIGTVRGTARTRLHELAERSPGRIEIATVDITVADQIGAMRSRLAARTVAGGVSWQQGGAERVHAQFRGTPFG
jgi:NAD(P)-dependent dehydrogenase (short-subunit alcohol dehydrogenase family)